MATHQTRHLNAEELLLLMQLRDEPGLSQAQLALGMGPPGLRSPSESGSERGRVWLLEQGYIEPAQDDRGKSVPFCWALTELGETAIDSHYERAVRDLDDRIRKRNRKHVRDGSTVPEEVRRLRYLKQDIAERAATWDREHTEPAAAQSGNPAEPVVMTTKKKASKKKRGKKKTRRTNASKVRPVNGRRKPRTTPADAPHPLPDPATGSHAGELP